MEDQIQELKGYLAEGKNVVVMTGAGVSSSAGIVTMAEMNKLKAMHVFFEPLVKLRPEAAYKQVKEMFMDPIFQNGPTLTHKKLVELEEQGVIKGIITNNIDHLHTIAGSKKVAEIQGSFAINKCIECEIHDDRLEIWNTGKYPRCAKCNGLMFPFPMYTLKDLDEDAVAVANKEAYELACVLVRDADYILTVGTKGYFAKYLDEMKPTARFIQINPGRTSFTRPALLNIKAEADEVFAQL